MDIIAYIFAFLIGISLGVLGSGGTILTVPMLVYLLHVKPVNATHYSMFIVGVSALIGVLLRKSKYKPDFNTAIQFLIPSVVTLFLTRKYILPAIPEQIQLFRHITFSKSVFLMTLFALLMIIVAFSMIKNFTTEKTTTATDTSKKYGVGIFILVAIIIGLLTGMLGAGGGFIIIPALIYFKNSTMQDAVSTSLLIITFNSFIGFASDLTNYVNWHMVLSIAFVSSIGMLASWKISTAIPNEKLKKIFGYAVLIIGVFIVLKEWML